MAAMESCDCCGTQMQDYNCAFVDGYEYDEYPSLLCSDCAEEFWCKSCETYHRGDCK